jgi:drug/metabolite transporter (DMT)-like permease
MSRRGGPAAWIALASVCFFWGTTYLGIRISIETLPPAFVICARFILSGLILLIAARIKGAHLPRGRDLRIACFTGILILGIGNAAVFYAEEIIPSGLAGLFVTLLPFWMVGLEAAMGGEPLHTPGLFGMVVGFAGSVLLLTSGTGGSIRSMLLGFLIIEIGGIGWTIGSLIQRRQPTAAHPIVIGAVQQLAAGLLYIPVAAFVPAQPIIFSQRSVWALLYLVTFGSIVGYSAYIFAMDRLPVAIVSIYPYINGAVAVFLGWLFFREAFGIREFIGMLIIFAGVAIVKYRTPNTERQVLRASRRGRMALVDDVRDSADSG